MATAELGVILGDCPAINGTSLRRYALHDRNLSRSGSRGAHICSTILPPRRGLLICWGSLELLTGEIDHVLVLGIRYVSE